MIKEFFFIHEMYYLKTPLYGDFHGDKKKLTNEIHLHPGGKEDIYDLNLIFLTSTSLLKFWRKFKKKCL